MDFGLESGDEATARQLVLDHREADLPPPDRALCDFAVKMTLAPGDLAEDDVARLRDHGFGDEQISLATQVISYFNYINRVADGLGVDDEPGMAPPREQWLRLKGRGYTVSSGPPGSG